jgi:CHAD domain-containing protein
MASRARGLSGRGGPAGGASWAATWPTAWRRSPAPTTRKGAHRARIAGKRLRYGLEVATPGAKRPLARLKGLQDLLGELHDVHGLMQRVSRLARRAARDRAERLAELAVEHGTASDEFRRQRGRRGPPWFALLEVLRQRQETLYGQLESEWRAGGEGASAGRIESLMEDARQRVVAGRAALSS